MKEQDWVRGLGAGRQQRKMLRLWTVKEAVFKADLNNKQRRLPHYQLADRAAMSATVLPIEHHFTTPPMSFTAAS
jgi:hypothetical protein